MAYEFHYQRLVHWQDTDLAGIIHYTNYFRYMDEAETEFYRSMGLHKLEDSTAEGRDLPARFGDLRFHQTGCLRGRARRAPADRQEGAFVDRF